MEVPTSPGWEARSRCRASTPLWVPAAVDSQQVDGGLNGLVLSMLDA